MKTYRSGFYGEHRFWDEKLGEWRSAQTVEELQFAERVRDALKNSMVENSENDNEDL